MIREILMTPGLSTVSYFVRESLSKEMIYHRTDEFRSILGDAHVG